MPRETAILERTRKVLASRKPSHFIKTSGQGEPDLVGSIDGRSVVCETKQPGKRPEAIQYVRLKQWAHAGALALWTNGVDVYQINRNGIEVFFAVFDKVVDKLPGKPSACRHGVAWDVTCDACVEQKRYDDWCDENCG